MGAIAACFDANGSMARRCGYSIGLGPSVAGELSGDMFTVLDPINLSSGPKEKQRQTCSL